MSIQPKMFADAIQRGDSPLIQTWIDSGLVDSNQCLPYLKYCPPVLVHAVMCEQLEIVKILLRANARINDADQLGNTACHAAAGCKKTFCDDVIDTLLVFHPNLNVKNSMGYTPLECISPIRSRAWLALVNAGACLDGISTDALCVFSVQSAEAIQALTNRGIVVRGLLHSSGLTPLHYAAANTSDDIAILRTFVNIFADNLDIRDRSGRTAIHSALLTNNVAALYVLINAGADVNCSGAVAPLYFTHDYNCVVTLLAAGSLVNIQEPMEALTPVHDACSVGILALASVHALVAAGANLDVLDNSGQSARQLLAKRNMSIDSRRVEKARRDICKARLDFCRWRALQVCLGLQSLGLPALQTCEILLFASGPVAPLIPFHQWWQIATAVKHFKKSQNKE